uniref:Uncharacterized protein n=1 Tax=Gasterosteus aculeatus aculeatus TaxID=481459 RepID=A0AAQ4QGU0_GASAC
MFFFFYGGFGGSSSLGSCAYEEEEEEDEGRKREGTGAERRRGSHSGGLRGAPLSAARRHSDWLNLRRRYHRHHCPYRRCLPLHSRVPFP